jgi:hypothetical protein
VSLIMPHMVCMLHCIWLLEPVYGTFMKRLDHVSHLEKSFICASLADYARTQLLSFECYDCVLLKISNLILRALVYSLLLGRLLCFIFGRASTRD